MTSTEKADKSRKSDPRRNFFKHVGLMPGWHKAIVCIAALLAIAGVAGHVYARMSGDAQVQVVKMNSTDPAAKNVAKDPVESKQSVGSVSKFAPVAMAVGFGVLAGFSFGWFLRTFMTSLAVLTMSTIAAFWLLSYLGVLHPATWNPEAFKGKSAEAATWMAVYAGQLKNLAFGNLLCTSASTFAACLGFRRF
jgi:uncharacterized membrane protein (Fun14 family)